jgi:LPXTG-motif cell wall-anchored protein
LRFPLRIPTTYCRYPVAPMIPRLIAALLAGALLAAPAAALAQSAGDDQYADPFDQVDEPSQKDGGSNGSPAPTENPTASAPADGAADSTQAAAETGSGGGTLPRTGFPAALGALLGVLLLGAGAMVRRRAQPMVALPPWLTPPAWRRARFGARRRRRR